MLPEPSHLLPSQPPLSSDLASRRFGAQRPTAGQIAEHEPVSSLTSIPLSSAPGRSATAAWVNWSTARTNKNAAKSMSGTSICARRAERNAATARPARASISRCTRSRRPISSSSRVSQAPVIFSHSSARALTERTRNVPDNILEMVAQKDGVVMVTFVPGFISPAVAAWNERQTAEQTRLTGLFPADAAGVTRGVEEWTRAHPAPLAHLADVADHIDHIRKVAGVEHIGLGGDFDGITAVPQGLEDVSTYPALTAELLRRGYKEDDLKKILGQNVLRVMREAERIATKLHAERGPSSMLFDQ